MTLALRQDRAANLLLADWDPRWKLLTFLGFGLSALLQPHGLLLGVQTLIVVGLGLLGRVPLSAMIARAGLLGLAALPLLIVGPLVDPTTWPRCIEAGLRIELMGLLALVLLRTDSLSRLLAAATALRAPRTLIQLVQLAYRFTFVILAEVRRRLIALRSRGFRLKTNWRTYQTLSYSLAGVLVQSAERAERVSAAMRCRGYVGELPTLHEFRSNWRDLGLAAGGLTFGVAMLAWGNVLSGRGFAEWLTFFN